MTYDILRNAWEDGKVTVRNKLGNIVDFEGLEAMTVTDLPNCRIYIGESALLVSIHDRKLKKEVGSISSVSSDEYATWYCSGVTGDSIDDHEQREPDKIPAIPLLQKAYRRFSDFFWI
ncbi:hypothetical protein HOL21_01945 [Candidatus Woesearchaeota archaeon]|nr:hypothetical protein [Candidatus Woesearchaeota archaeon]